MVSREDMSIALPSPRSPTIATTCARRGRLDGAEQHVGGLDVAVQDAAVVQRGEALPDLVDDVERLRARQPAAGSRRSASVPWSAYAITR